jgi:7-carboxy-7-deazaguanine synthase
MAYYVKEIYYTLQGEGFHTGRPAVFCRFARCNLWNGKESSRATAQCRFCDTDFIGVNGPGGGRFSKPHDLAAAICNTWGGSDEERYVVCTGGEPLLQLDAPLVDALHDEGFTVAIETNGTLAPPAGIDWICVSPKAGTTLKCRQGNELKLVYPQPDVDPADYLALEFTHYWLQPMDGPQRDQATEQAISYCLKHPRWHLSLQTHKYIGIP